MFSNINFTNGNDTQINQKEFNQIIFKMSKFFSNKIHTNNSKENLNDNTPAESPAEAPSGTTTEVKEEKSKSKIKGYEFNVITFKWLKIVFLVNYNFNYVGVFKGKTRNSFCKPVLLFLRNSFFNFCSNALFIQYCYQTRCACRLLQMY